MNIQKRIQRCLPIILSVILGVLSTNSFALTSASCTGTTITTCATYPTNYSSVGNIVIGEGANTDWTSGNGRTLILAAPANFQFNTTGVTVAVTNGSRLSNMSVTVTASNITVTYDLAGGGGGPTDQMTIYGVQVRATAASGAVNITRSGGTGAMLGFTAGSNVAGSLSTNDLGAPATKTFDGSTNNDWNTAANWTPAGVPGTCSNVVIPATFNVTTSGAGTCNNLTIQNGGTLTTNSAVTVGGTFTIDAGGTYVHNNTTDPGTTIFAGSESFATTSTIDVRAWNSAANPLGQYATAFGHIIFQAPLTAWDQDGTFAPNKIKGNVTITNVQVNWDDGTGATTALTIDGSVSTTGSGGCIFQEGADRNLTLTTGSFTHDGTGLAAGLYLSAGTFVWTINGDMSVSDDFTGIEGGGTGDPVDCTVNITGDFNISGGLFDWNRGVDGDMDLNVTGDINITGAPGWVRFNDGFNGVLTVDCDNFNIGGGTDNDLQKGDGGATITTVTDFNVTGGTTHLLDLSDGNLTLNVGGTFDQDAGTFYGIDGGGPTATGNIITSSFGAIDFDGGNFTLHDGNNTGSGTVTVNVTNDMDINFTGASDGFGLINVISSGFPSASANTLLLDLDVGGDFNVTGNTSALFFTSGTSGDEAIDIVGNLVWNGGIKFINGSEAAGSGHNVVMNVGGNAQFGLGTGHLSGVNGNVTCAVGGNTTVTGGTNAIKVLDGTGTYTTGGSFSQTAGTFYHHKSSTNTTADVVTVTVGGAFSQTGGVYNFDQNASSTSTHTLTLNGSSITLGGSGLIARAGPGTSTVFGEIYVNPTSGSTTYDRTATTHRLNQTKVIINAAKTMDASGSTVDIQLAAHDAADDVVPPTTVMLDIYGVLNAGTKIVHGRAPSATYRPTSVFVRSGGEIQTANTSGLYDGGITATLNARTLNSANSGNGVNSMNWWLDANSRVTYNGTGDQVVTGKYPVDFTSTTNNDATLASTAGYHYAYLEIDHQGTIGTNYVYPAASNVFVRTQLDMDRGEFRLDGSGTGYTINIENPATTGIIVTGASGDAYIRSETNLGTNPSIVRWYMETTAGAHVIPFGHSSGASNYVPFTFDVNSGGAAGSYVDVSTRATDDGTVANNKDNLPWATGVTNMWADFYNQDGATESVIDRWWQIDVSTAYDADLTFSYRGVENTLDAPNNVGNIGAQRWDGTEWLPDNSNFGSAPAVMAGVGTCTVTGVTAFSPWVLSSLNAPLPVELISFEGVCEDEHLKLTWSVASEMNCDKYIIYTSENGEGFSYLSEVQAIGNSSTALQYMYDGDLIENNFYKLVSLDFDGKEEELGVTKLESCGSNGEVVHVYPNPVDIDYVYVMTDVDLNDQVFVNIFDMTGKLVQTSQFKSFEEGISVQVSIEDLPKGMYLLTVENGGVTYREMIVLDR